MKLLRKGGIGAQRAWSARPEIVRARVALFGKAALRLSCNRERADGDAVAAPDHTGSRDSPSVEDEEFEGCASEGAKDQAGNCGLSVADVADGYQHAAGIGPGRCRLRSSFAGRWSARAS